MAVGFSLVLLALSHNRCREIGLTHGSPFSRVPRVNVRQSDARQILIERKPGYYGMIRTLRILVDGVLVARIGQGETLPVDIPAGSREIWGKMDWGETVRVGIASCTPDKILVFRSYFTLNPFKNFGISKLPFEVFLRDRTENGCKYGCVSNDI